MSYLKNKKNRMKTKYSNIFMKDFRIEIADTPTNVLAVCNGGLCSGINEDMVCEVFSKFGTLENIIMVPGKSYSFVKFQNESVAAQAYDSLNGDTVWPQIKGPVYLNFVKKLNETDFDEFKNFQKPPGLILIEDFVTEKEESFILSLVDSGNDEKSSELKNRKVKHFGYEFKYSTNNVDLGEPIKEIPKGLDFLWERLKKHGVEFTPDQLTVNCYEPGQGIPPHVDTHSAFEDGIVSLSLCSSIVMEFRNKNGACNRVLLPERSLCVMMAESRYDWTHGIASRKSDVVIGSDGGLKVESRKTRISLTFRKTRSGDCACNFPRLCDSALKQCKSENIVSDMRTIKLEKKLASELEGNYVHDVYEKIACHFSETRHKPWPNVKKFVESFPVGSILVDVGCGNGKYFTKQSQRFEIGCDSSFNLLKVCQDQGFECFSCNCLNVPVRDNAVDGCICIAVIHHLTTEERRTRALKEIIRILRSKGRALIYVWAKNQEKESVKSSYLKQCSRQEEKSETEIVKLEEELILPVHVNRTNFKYNDLLVPWKLKTKDSKSRNSEEGPVYLRFYHVYEDDELKNTCSEIEEVDVIEYYYDQGNWCIMLQKK